MNRFAHLKEAQETPITADAPIVDLSGIPAEHRDADLIQSVSKSEQGTSGVEVDDLQELVYLVERRIGIVGKIPASLKDAYDEMLLRTRKYIGRPNADLAVQAWVELTLEDEVFQKRWLKRMQELRKK